MSAVIHYLPTANNEPLPRRPNRGRLPEGVVRLSVYKRAVARGPETKFKYDFDAAARTLADWHRRGFKVTAQEVLRIQRVEFYQARGLTSSPASEA